MDPESLMPVLNMGNLLHETGNTGAAIAFLEKKRARFPRAPEIFHNLGGYWEGAGDPPRAIQYLEAAILVQPGYRPSLEHLRKLRQLDMTIKKRLEKADRNRLQKCIR